MPLEANSQTPALKILMSDFLGNVFTDHVGFGSLLASVQTAMQVSCIGDPEPSGRSMEQKASGCVKLNFASLLERITRLKQDRTFAPKAKNTCS